LSETVWLLLVAGVLSASAVTMAAWPIARIDPRLPDRVVGELRLARWVGILVAAVGGISIGLSTARPDLAMAHLEASLGVVFVGLGGIVLQREPREGLLLASALFLAHALLNIAHRPGWLSVDLAPHWFTVGCAVYDVYLAGLCFWVWRR
jgi:hypothetical protein